MVNVTHSDVQILRAWIRQQQFLPQSYDDRFLRYVILACKGSIEQAKWKYDMFHKRQIDNPRFFQDYDPLSNYMRAFQDAVQVITLPQKSAEGYTVVIMKLNSTDPTHISFDRCALSLYYNNYTMLLEDGFGSVEEVIVLDCTGLHIGHAKVVTPDQITNVLGIGLDGTIPRIKAIHVIGVPKVLEWMIYFAQRLLPDKIGKRLVVHSDSSSLLDYFPKKLLPTEYGGEGPSMNDLNEEYITRLQRHRATLVAQKQLRLTEAQLRPKIENSPDEMSGTFKKLSID